MLSLIFEVAGKMEKIYIFQKDKSLRTLACFSFKAARDQNWKIQGKSRPGPHSLLTVLTWKDGLLEFNTADELNII